MLLHNIWYHGVKFYAKIMISERYAYKGTNRNALYIDNKVSIHEL